MSADVHDEGQVRALLPHTWHAFFGRFGRLRSIQRQAIPVVAAGLDVLVHAPTASGKTEALVAPLLERALSQRAGAPAVLVVAPTRALCNDLGRRLKAPVQRAGATLGIKTSDARELEADAPPTVLITTPESLDSILSRRPALLRGLRSVLFDELHLLAASARGDQLRCLRERLLRVSEHSVQSCGASATLPNGEELAQAFLGARARLVNDPDTPARGVVASLRAAADVGEVAQAIRELYDEAPARKLLVFANTRGQVESIAARLGRDERLRTKTYAHHGSLARAERLRVESAFLGAPTAICVATMTLELGVDIGDVDRVVLVGPPGDAASLMQRVGRANRSESASLALCLHANDFERQRFEHLLDCAARGVLFPDRVAFRPQAIAQQALSLAFQNPQHWVGLDALHTRLPEEARALWSPADCLAILHTLVERGYLSSRDGQRFQPEERARRLYERGQMHSMIRDTREIEVVDAATGRPLGRVRLGRAEREAVDGESALRLSLGGRGHRATRLRDGQLWVERTGEDGPTRFQARETPRYSHGLARDFARFLGHDEHSLPLCTRGPDRWQLAHFQGTVWGLLLFALLEARGYFPLRHTLNPFFVELERAPAEGTLGSEQEIRRILGNRFPRIRRRLQRALQPGAFGDCVPAELYDRWTLQSARIDAFAAQAAHLTLRELSGTDSAR